MTKKLLSTFLFVASVAISSMNAQCVPNVSCIPAGATYGICPDSATGMAIGTVGVPYTQVMSMMVPVDATDFGFTGVPITSIDIVSVDSLAPGLSYVCSPAGCSFPGNSNGCILITGTPSTVWNHQVIVNAMGHATIGVSISIPQTNKQYRSIVVAAAGIESLDMTKFDVDQNSPNPFSENTEIHFSSVSASNVDFKVYNVLGDVVFNNQFRSEKGVNTIKVAANSFSPGVYIYSITNGDKTITKRMIVASK